ncbi:right-handed parallel beta-helix repeat-containing protein [Streptomyces sp. NPDC002611]
MALYTFGGTPSDVLTDAQGNVIPDYPLIVRAAGTGAAVTALFEADGITPIAQLRSNPSGSTAPGAVRTFKVADVSEVEYEYLGPGGQPLRWYQAGREVASGARDAASQALAAAGTKLDMETPDPQTVDGPVNFASPISAPNLGDQSAERWFVVSGPITGTAADRLKVQAQLDAAGDAGGGIVYVPPGLTYGIDTFLVVHEDTTIWAYGATFKAIGNSGLLRNFKTTDLFAGYTGRSRIRVLGGTWDGNAAHSGVGTVTSETNIMNFVHCRDVTVRDAVLTNVSTAHALEFNGCDGGRALNCQFLGFKDNSVGGTRGFSEAVQVDITKSGSSSIGDFDNTPARNILVQGCYFGPSTRLGAFGRAVGSHTLVAGITYDNIQVLDNRIDGTLQEGIHPYGWTRAVIARNVITGTGKSGILATLTDPATTSVAPTGLNISDNVIDGAGEDSGIRVLSYPAYKYPGVVISGNVIRSVTGNGIHAEHCQSPSITGNRVTSTTSTGIYAHYSDGANLTGNTCRSVGSNALNLSGTVGATVAGNTVDGTSSNFGVFVGQGSDGTTNSTDAVISGNNITAPAGSGIRLSTNATGCLVVGNKVRKAGGAATSALSMAASATGCTVLSNDFSGNGWNASAAMGVTTSAPVTGPGGMTALPGTNLVDGDLSPLPALESAMRPAGRYETTSRLRLGTSSTPTSGMLYLVPIWLPKGYPVANLSFVSGSTAAATPTNWWFSLHDSTRKMLARTADQLTASWAANTVKTLPIAQTTAGAGSSYTTTYAGLHYLGVMVKASTVCNLISEGSMPDTVAQVTPGFGGTDAGMSTPPTVSGAGFTAGAFGTGSGILAYGYAS